jgi:hypothetical protein
VSARRGQAQSPSIVLPVETSSSVKRLSTNWQPNGSGPRMLLPLRGRKSLPLQPKRRTHRAIASWVRQPEPTHMTIDPETPRETSPGDTLQRAAGPEAPAPEAREQYPW